MIDIVMQLNARHGYGEEIGRTDGKLWNFAGHYSQNARDGSGVLTESNMDTYDGEWKGGVKHGLGEEWQGADHYKGSYVNGEYEGSGSLLMGESGDLYTGEFRLV